MDRVTAFAQVNNLDIPESRRRFSPQWATVAVDRAGRILDVIRHRQAPNAILHRQHMDLYPQSVQFTASPGMYATLEEFEAKVKECVWAGENY